MNTAVAIVTVDVSGTAVPGVIVYLYSPSLPSGFEFGITNNDGYWLWPSVPVPFTGKLILAGAAAPYGPGGNGVDVAVPARADVTIRVGTSPSNPQDILRPPCSRASFKKPFTPAPRVWAGNFCGVRVPGLPAVPGGAPDASLVLSWFIDRYSPSDRQRIYTHWRLKNYTHVVVSWPDSRGFGQSPQQFAATCQELIAEGFYPCVFLSSKDFDPANVDLILDSLEPVMPLLVGMVPMFCVGWELSLWLSPTQVQQLIDALAPQWLKQVGTLGYVHFQEDYFSFPQPDHDNASFWNLQVGKLTGVLHQKGLSQDNDLYRARLVDCLQRCAGQFNMPVDSGFGHPFDCVAFEITAAQQFNGSCSEADGDALGRWAIHTPAQSGPAGTVVIMGSGNGS